MRRSRSSIRAFSTASSSSSVDASTSSSSTIFAARVLRTLISNCSADISFLWSSSLATRVASLVALVAARSEHTALSCAAVAMCCRVRSSSFISASLFCDLESANSSCSFWSSSNERRTESSSMRVALTSFSTDTFSRRKNLISSSALRSFSLSSLTSRSFCSCRHQTLLSLLSVWSELVAFRAANRSLVHSSSNASRATTRSRHRSSASSDAFRNSSISRTSRLCSFFQLSSF
mmetsp:Transcript_33082/g.49952  ORF Transcript_33082/g.49952 Transcript_33082/m.49952 type:complete len:234 (+) Transcript_33082:1272-1973(+)